MRTGTLAAQIQEEVGSWPDVRVDVYSHGMIFFHVGRREIGHLHGDRLADLPVPIRIREKLVAAGQASEHYLHPKSGWITYYMKSDQDVRPVIELFRLNYHRPWLVKHDANPGASPDPDSD
jgi:hypothetical protein